MKTYNVEAVSKEGYINESANFCFNDVRETLTAAMRTARKLAKRNFYVRITTPGERGVVWEAGVRPEFPRFADGNF